MRLVFAVAFLSLLVCSSGLPQHVRDGTFSTRSGQIALGFASDELFSASSSSSSSSSASLFINSPQFASVPARLADHQVVDFLSYSLGLSPLHLDASVDRTAYPQASSAFSKPAASLLVILEDVASSYAAQFPSIEVTQSYLSNSALSTLETIFSGSLPAEHGIIADNWYSFEKHAQVEALSPAGGPYSPSFFDLVSATDDEQSLHLYVAGNDQLASLLGSSSPSSKKEQLDLAFLSSKLASAAASLSVLRGGQEVHVALGEETAVFDLEQTSHKQFLAQLVAIYQLVDNLTCKQDNPYADQIVDSSPDMFVFAFSSLASFDSETRAVATRLVDAVVELATVQISAVYGQRLFSAYLQTAPLLPGNLQDACSSLSHLDWVADVSIVSLARTCPTLYLSPSLSFEQINSLRTQLAEDLSPFGVSAFVLPQHYAAFFHAVDSSEQAGKVAMKQTYTFEEMSMFQITLWTSIALFFTLVAVLGGMFCLTWEGENSPVFIETNTIQKNNIDPSNL